MFGKVGIFIRDRTLIILNTMASVKIILRTNKINKAGLAPLYLQIIHDRKSAEVSLKRYISPADWDADKQRVKKSYTGYSPLNIFLSNEKRAYEQIMDEKRAAKESFTVRDIMAIRKGKHQAHGSKGRVVEFLDQFIKDNPEGLKYYSLAAYRTAMHRIEAYKPKTTFSDIKLPWLQGFEKFLTEEGLRVNTIHNRLKIVRKITRIALREGWVDKNPFDHFKLKTEAGVREFLTRDELRSLQELEIPQPSYRLVRDVFVFSCHTGLRFGDLCMLGKEHVNTEQGADGEKFFVLGIKMQKTQELLSLKLSKMAASIVEIYQDVGGDYLFPIIGSQKRAQLTSEVLLKKEISRRNAYFNKVLAMLIERAEINKKISMHCARHTFATLMLDLGASIEVVSKLIGHKDLKVTQIYAKVLDKAKHEAIDRLDAL
jgi:integrase/recombinase XerD